MKESEFLHVGDPVWWKGGWGAEEACIAEIDGIKFDCDMHFYEGTPAERLSWRRVTRFATIKCPDGEELASAVVTLANGHWAFGWQLWPLKIWARTYEEDCF